MTSHSTVPTSDSALCQASSGQTNSCIGFFMRGKLINKKDVVEL